MCADGLATSLDFLLDLLGREAGERPVGVSMHPKSHTLLSKSTESIPPQ